MKALIKPTLLLAIVALCLFEFVLDRQIGMFREFEFVLLETQWMLLVCLAVWCGTFLFLTFSLKDLPLIGLLLIAIAAYFISQTENSPATDTITILFGVTLGRAIRFFVYSGGRRKPAPTKKAGTGHSELTSAATFLIGLVLLLAFSAFWHLDMTNNFYRGPRWMGLWNNPNDYGLLMSAGLVLAMGLLMGIWDLEFGVQNSMRSFAVRWFGKDRRRGDESHSGNPQLEIENQKVVTDSLRRPLPILLFVTVLMLGTGLFFSYSRGAWVGTATGLLYLAKAHGKFKWWGVLLPVFIAMVVICFFWNNTPDNAPWYLKRLDLSRASTQHRVAAWKAGFEIMRDHPFGVGWNKAASFYEKNYSPPEGGAAAITTNDYLMLGTQMGIPGLVCFVAYVALCFRNHPGFVAADVRRLHLKSRKSEPPHVGSYSLMGSEEGIIASPVTRHIPPAITCHSAMLAMAVAFWFDYGLFKLATASVFWILLELGAETGLAAKWHKKAQGKF
jgi:O-antigen ligase